MFKEKYISPMCLQEEESRQCPRSSENTSRMLRMRERLCRAVEECPKNIADTGLDLKVLSVASWSDLWQDTVSTEWDGLLWYSKRLWGLHVRINWCSYYLSLLTAFYWVGNSKKLVQIFLRDVMEKHKWTFWPTWYIYTYICNSMISTVHLALES